MGAVASIGLVVMLVGLVVVVGAMLAMTPWLMPRQECFAVTVPPVAHADPRIVAAKRAYTAIVVALTLVGAACTVLGRYALDEGAFMVVWTVVLGVLVLVPFLLMLVFRARVRRIKREAGWKASSEVSAAVVVEGDLPAPVSLAWHLIDLVPIALTVVLFALLWDRVPDLVPMHADLEGNINGWSAKGPGVFLFPLLMQVFLTACFVGGHAVIGRSRRPVNPRAPMSSALSYALFARAMGWCLVAMGFVTDALFLAFPLSSAGIITLGQAGITVGVGILPPIVAFTIVALIYGQAGSRVLSGAPGDADDEMACDDDDHWKLGIFYVNRDDPSWLVPERFGVGWTVNFGRPAAWVFLIGTLVFSGVIIALCMLL